MEWMKGIMTPMMSKFIFCKELKRDISILKEDLKDIVYNQYLKNGGEDLYYEMVKQIDNDLGYIDIAVDEAEEIEVLRKYRKIYNQYVKNLKQYC